MTTLNPKQDWAEVEDDEEGNETRFVGSKVEDNTGGRYETVRVSKPIERVGADGVTERVDQVFLVKKWVFPVRKQVLERKKMAKFGDVKDIPKGDHLTGDTTIEKPINIERAEDQAEIGIVGQIENISTGKVLQNKMDREMAIGKEPPVEEKKDTDKWSSVFKSSAQRQAFAIRVTNIICYETNLTEIERDLQEYFKHLLEKKGLRISRFRILKTKDNPPRFLNKCIISFDNNENAAKALDVIDGAAYNDAYLEASWAEANDPKRRR
jgi:hypothetical protein